MNCSLHFVPIHSPYLLQKILILSMRIFFFFFVVMQVDDTEVISFLLQTEIIPLCLRTMEMGSELSKTVCSMPTQFLFKYQCLFLLLSTGKGVIGFKVCVLSSEVYLEHYYSAMRHQLSLESSCPVPEFSLISLITAATTTCLPHCWVSTLSYPNLLGT
jgi:hypothetical protein